jgi:hypothetical protein
MPRVWKWALILRATLYLGPDWGLARAFKIWANRIVRFPSNWAQGLYTWGRPEHSLTTCGVLGGKILAPNHRVLDESLGRAFPCPELPCRARLGSSIGLSSSCLSITRGRILFLPSSLHSSNNTTISINMIVLGCFDKRPKSWVPSHLRLICTISVVESMEVGNYHFTLFPSPKSLEVNLCNLSRWEHGSWELPLHTVPKSQVTW